jgi:hypothetical protein
MKLRHMLTETKASTSSLDHTFFWTHIKKVPIIDIAIAPEIFLQYMVTKESRASYSFYNLTNHIVKTGFHYQVFFLFCE